MSKTLISISLMLISSLGAYANDDFNDGLLENMDIKTFVSTLNDIEGYFFVGLKEDRDISLTLSRPDGSGDAKDYAKWEWKTMNYTIAGLSRGEEDAPILTGGAYGETIITGTETKEDGTTDNHNFVVFVCPKITIVSPEGAIYSYHKVYNQNTRIQFTQSQKYSVNSVLRYDGVHPEGLDITSYITRDGWYESTDQITGDTTFWVAMEENTKANDSSTATGSSNLKVFVHGSDVTIEGNNSYTFTVKDILGKQLYKGTWPANGTLTFDADNQGVFFITCSDSNNTYKTYKIIIDNNTYNSLNDNTL